MKLSNKQAMMLLEIAKTSCRIASEVWPYTQERRIDLISNIINQQSDELIDLEKNKNGTK